jgi:hypothetical protein
MSCAPRQILDALALVCYNINYLWKNPRHLGGWSLTQLYN